MKSRGGVFRIIALAGLLAAAGTGSSWAELPLDRQVGDRVANFTLRNTEGNDIQLFGYRGKKAVVLVFLGTQCPVGNAYLPRLNELAEKYQSKGVIFLGINSNSSESMEAIAQHKKEYGLTFPVLRDDKNKVADALIAERTCEVLVIDGRARLRYRGAIDDQYMVGGKQRDKAEKTYLVDAIEALLANKQLAVKCSPVEGCPIEKVAPEIKTIAAKRVRGPSGEVAKAYAEIEAKLPPVEVGKVTYATEVAAILQNRCQSCHRPGQSAPFSLLTYDDARRWSAGIAEVVEERRMPPWHADPRHGKFANDRSLSPKERATLLAWVDQGTPLGDPAKVPAAKTFPGEWTIGKPDLVIEIPNEYTVPAQGTVEYVHMRVPTGFTKDMWIQAAEAIPGDRSVVHHIIAYVDDHKNGRGRLGEEQMHLCGYAPGDMPSVYPPGSAKRIPAGSDIVFQLHYTPNGKVRTDRSKLGIIFAKAPVEHEAHTLGIVQTQFMIPPGAASHEVTSSVTLDKNVRLLAFMPHMHLRGKDFKYTLTLPGKQPEVLLSVPAYDFGWQSYYTLEKPRDLPKGARIDCVAHFDNSKENPANPDPSKLVRWGDQTYEEMMIGYIDYVDIDPPAGKTAKTERPQPARGRSSLDISKVMSIRSALKLLGN